MVVNEGYRGRNLGRRIIAFLGDLAKKEGCYKVILDCAEKNVSFYRKCGYEVKGAQMALYFD